MPSGKLCSIPGCEKSPIARSLCASHYRRLMKHGSATGGSTSKGAPLKFIREVALEFTGAACLPWPFAKSGPEGREPYVYHEGRMQLAHRVVCRMAHGEPPTPDHHAAHECGNGHLACINPAHLRWKTPLENEADKLRHGTRPFGSQVHSAVLKEHQVIEIMALHGTVAAERVADQYGVHFNTIRHIWSGRRWGWLTRPRAVPAST